MAQPRPILTELSEFIRLLPRYVSAVDSQRWPSQASLAYTRTSRSLSRERRDFRIFLKMKQGFFVQSIRVGVERCGAIGTSRSFESPKEPACRSHQLSHGSKGVDLKGC